MFFVACGGATQTRGEVTVTPLPTATAQPTTPAALPQASATPPPSACTRPLEGTSICFAGGNGTSAKDAIVILGAKGEEDGVDAEYKYLASQLGKRGVDYVVEQQSLLEDGGHAFDRLSVRLQDGTVKEVFFDISDYFGKF